MTDKKESKVNIKVLIVLAVIVLGYWYMNGRKFDLELVQNFVSDNKEEFDLIADYSEDLLASAKDYVSNATFESVTEDTKNILQKNVDKLGNSMWEGLDSHRKQEYYLVQDEVRRMLEGSEEIDISKLTPDELNALIDSLVLKWEELKNREN